MTGFPARFRPAIDQSYLSPSGRVSQRAKRVSDERVRRELFPPGFWDWLTQSRPMTDAEKAASLRAAAMNLRELADRGMRPRAHRREADRLDALAADLTPTIR